MVIVHLLALVLLQCIANQAAVGQPCSLVWKSAGYGKIPINSVQIGEAAAEKHEYIGRVRLENGLWTLGRLTALTGAGYKIQVIQQGQQIWQPPEFKTYQVLTNPRNACQLVWSDDHLLSNSMKNSLIPVEHVQKGSSNRGPIIGRARFAGQWIVGIVNAVNHSVRFTYDGDLYEQTALQIQYQTLLSFHGSKLQLDLMNFEYELDPHTIHSNTRQVEISQSQIIRKDSNNLKLNQHISYSKMFVESFKILPSSNWLDCNLAEIRLVNMDLWCSSAELVQHRFVIPEENLTLEDVKELLVFERIRNVSIIGDVRSTADTLNGHQHEITSTMSVFTGSVPFHAEGRLMFGAGEENTTRTLSILEDIAKRCQLRVERKTNRYAGISQPWLSVRVHGELAGKFITGVQANLM